MTYHDIKKSLLHSARYNATMSEREKREADAKHAACMEHRSAILLQVQYYS